MTVRPLIVGLGSPHGDDQAGWLVIKRLQERGMSPITVRTASNPTELWDYCDRDRMLLICDACCDATPPGSLRRWNWPHDTFPTRHHGTHDFPLSTALTMGAELGCVPMQVTVWTISGEGFWPGTTPSETIQSAAVTLADRLWEEFSNA